MMDESEVLRLVEKLAHEEGKRRPTRKEFLAGLAKQERDLDTYPDAKFAAEDVWYDIKASRIDKGDRSDDVGPDETPRSEDTEAPTSWGDYGVNVFIRYEYLRQHAMALFNLKAALGTEQIEGFLQEVAAHERKHEGDELQLVYPTGNGSTLDPMKHTMPVWRGIYHQEWKERVRGERPATRDLKTAKERIVAANTWRTAREQRLARLVDLSEEIATWTGVGKHEAVAFLLCNLYSRPPWLRATAHIRTGAPVSEVLEPSFTIEVGSPRVTPRAVMEAYARVRRWVLAGGNVEELSRTKARGEKRLRPLDDQTMRLFHFVQARLQTRRDDWSDMYQDYSREYPGQYKSADTMRRAYNRAAQTRGINQAPNDA